MVTFQYLSSQKQLVVIVLDSIVWRTFFLLQRILLDNAYLEYRFQVFSYHYGNGVLICSSLTCCILITFLELFSLWGKKDILVCCHFVLQPLDCSCFKLSLNCSLTWLFTSPLSFVCYDKVSCPDALNYAKPY